jgi:Flp pilus assembly protein TadB
MDLVLAVVGACALALAGLPIFRRFGGRSTRRSGPPPGAGLRGRLESLALVVGLSPTQVLLGGVLWGGGLGALTTTVGGPLFFPVGLAAGLLLYAQVLESRRQELLVQATRDLETALGTFAMLLEQGQPVLQALEGAAETAGPVGGRLLRDLLERLQRVPEGQETRAVAEWVAASPGPGPRLLATVLIAGLEGRVRMAPLAQTLRGLLTGLLTVLGRARAEARGIEWQARFLALWPPGVVAFLVITGLGLGGGPLVALPVLLGSGLSYLLTTRQLRRDLSVEVALGVRG